MMTCKEVSTLVSTEELATVPFAQRLAAWLHLAMCRHCRAFRRQLNAVARAAHLVSRASEREPPSDFERKIVDRLGE
jgi:predicted anti-sigma-YlaC factor YlaD